jgi:hypothetical protein
MRRDQHGAITATLLRKAFFSSPQACTHPAAGAICIHPPPAPCLPCSAFAVAGGEAIGCRKVVQGDYTPPRFAAFQLFESFSDLVQFEEFFTLFHYCFESAFEKFWHFLGVLCSCDFTHVF